MSPLRTPPLNLQGVPTLTEVIEMPGDARASGPPRPAPGADSLAPAIDSVGQVPPVEPARFDEEGLVQRVLADLQRHADPMLEARLREALAPALARLTDALLSEAREALHLALRDVVAHAVSEASARQRVH